MVMLYDYFTVQTESSNAFEYYNKIIKKELDWRERENILTIAREYMKSIKKPVFYWFMWFQEDLHINQ
jgi:hypothetical protein